MQVYGVKATASDAVFQGAQIIGNHCVWLNYDRATGIATTFTSPSGLVAVTGRKYVFDGPGYRTKSFSSEVLPCSVHVELDAGAQTMAGKMQGPAVAYDQPAEQGVITVF